MMVSLRVDNVEPSPGISVLLPRETLFTVEQCRCGPDDARLESDGNARVSSLDVKLRMLTSSATGWSGVVHFQICRRSGTNQIAIENVRGRVRLGTR